jgi:phage terminase large subunit
MQAPEDVPFDSEAALSPAPESLLAVAAPEAQVATDLRTQSLRDRLERLIAIADDPALQALEREICSRGREGFYHWMRYWVWTFDPRLASSGGVAHIPFALFPRQEEMCEFLFSRLANREDGLIEKSRDIGFTWVAAAFSIWHWINVPGFTITFGSRVETLVDKRGVMDSIFEKMRQIIRSQPAWLTPDGFDWKQHDNHMRLINPFNGNTVSGEAGIEIGRGGRSSMLIIDEAAFLPNGDAVDAATSGNSDVRIWGSSVNGMGNIFARKRHGGALRPDQIFRFHWSDDSRKTPEWAAKKRRTLEPHVWASEYDLDYSASVEGICIPAMWVTAAIELARMYTARPARKGIGGLDVGAGGKGKSVFIARFGAIVLPPISWGNPDTIETAHRGIEEAEKITLERGDGWECRVSVMAYDSPGVGVGVQSALRYHRRHGLSTVPVNTGAAPSETEWPDGESSQEKFLNLRGELWWLMRARFKASYEMWLLLSGETAGQPHPIDECILLPDMAVGPDVQMLVSQLSLPRWFRNEKGKIQLEGKDTMRKRGIASPDHADALALTFLPDPDPLEVWRKIGRAY